MNIGKKTYLFLIPTLIAIHFCLGFYCLNSKSPSFDEPMFLTGGYYYNLQSDFRVNAEGGVLSQRLAALPAYFSPIKLPPQVYNDQFPKCQAFVILRLLDMTPDLNRLFNNSRMMILLLSCGLAWMLYFVSSRIFSRRGGLISLFMYCFCPLVISHATFITADLCVSFFFLIAIFFSWRLFRLVSMTNFIFAAIGIGGVILSKMSGLIIVPIYGICLTAACSLHYNCRVCFGTTTQAIGGGRRFLMLSGISAAGIITVYLMIWAIYDFRFSSSENNSERNQPFLYTFWEEKLEKSPLKDLVCTAIEKQLLPESFLRELTVTSSYGARPGFMNGQRNNAGSLWFFPYALMIKNPLPEILLVIAGIGSFIYFYCRASNRFTRKKWRRTWFMLFPFVVMAAVYIGIAIFFKLNIGLRHLLPVYPVFFLFAGALGEWFRRRNTPAIIFIIGLLGGMVWCNARITPYYNSYFNCLAGGPENGWKNLVDSSLDWGQDLQSLKQKLTGKNDKIYISYFGGPYFLPERILAQKFDYPVGFLNLKDERMLLDFHPGLYCFSATMLWNIYDPSATEFELENSEYYRKLYRHIQDFKAAAANPKAMEKLSRLGDAYWSRVFHDFDRYRYARLCRYLRQRQPDDYAGYSILIYKLNEQELKDAISP